ncbi:MAG TPA: hypothetical protein GXZ48_03475 [Acholeplasmataceae bacterium]|jgi:DNA-directed RNA polymerase subunit delta|nr:hypothetical protein [Acholeplasmataceae bacterium]
MTNNNESLVEIAVRLMRSKKKPKNMIYITNEVFQAKGIRDHENLDKLKAQFQLDFMLSGEFICCGEDKNGYKLWDLKGRQPSTLLDKDGVYLEDLYEDDEDVIKNELKDDFDDEKVKDEDEDEEEDDIEEELKNIDDDDDLLIDDDDEGVIILDEDDDEDGLILDDEEDEDDDLDKVLEGLEHIDDLDEEIDEEDEEE